jgi:uncharacterized protein YndB with AHSA1/START domain/ketosteroid isomerase-like protein
MPPRNQTSSDTKVIVDRTNNTIILTREFTVSRDLVFEAWTQPEHVACWWDASGTRLRTCEIDLRPGGAFKFVHQGPPEVPPFAGIYRKIAPPGELVFEAMGTIGKVILKDLDGTTLMTVSIACASAAHLDQFLQMGVDVGTSQTLDNLVVYVGGLKRPVLGILDAYKASVFAKDVDAFLVLYDRDVHVFDMWGAWSHNGIEAWREMVVNWFSSLGSDRVMVGFDDVRVVETSDLAFIHAFVTYKGISAEGTELRAMNNRMTLALKQKDDIWKVVHEHTSAPVNQKTLTVTLKRTQ